MYILSSRSGDDQHAALRVEREEDQNRGEGAAAPQQNEGMMLRGYENHEAIALVTCAS